MLALVGGGGGGYQYPLTFLFLPTEISLFSNDFSGEIALFCSWIRSQGKRSKEQDLEFTTGLLKIYII